MLQRVKVSKYSHHRTEHGAKGKTRRRRKKEKGPRRKAGVDGDARCGLDVKGLYSIKIYRHLERTIFLLTFCLYLLALLKQKKQK